MLSRVSRLARHLDIARRGAFAAHGLESWEFDVLSALRRAGPPFQLTPGALLRATLVTSGTMTNRIDRLAAAGLVSREPDPRDRRGVLVTLSERGKAVVDAAFTDLLEREQALLVRLGDEQRQVLADLLRTLLVPFDEGDVYLAGDPHGGLLRLTRQDHRLVRGDARHRDRHHAGDQVRDAEQDRARGRRREGDGYAEDGTGQLRRVHRDAARGERRVGSPCRSARPRRSP